MQSPSDSSLHARQYARTFTRRAVLVRSEGSLRHSPAQAAQRKQAQSCWLATQPARSFATALLPRTGTDIRHSRGRERPDTSRSWLPRCASAVAWRSRARAGHRQSPRRPATAAESPRRPSPAFAGPDAAASWAEDYHSPRVPGNKPPCHADQGSNSADRPRRDLPQRGQCRDSPWFPSSSVYS